LKKFRQFLGIGLVLILLLSSCQSLGINLPWLQQPTATPTPGPGGSVEETATPEATISVEATPQAITQLTLWVPPEMDPEAGTDASQMFTERLQQFSDQHNGLVIDVRVKATSGTGGLLDALTATSAAAPDALPDLIALSRPDLETAALKNLIYPLDGKIEIPDDPDWFGFAREMALLQGSTFGLPFAADALVLVYRPASLPEFPSSWQALFEGDLTFAFPSDSDQALFTLALYEAEGGLIQDNQRRPVLEMEPLTTVFNLYQDGAQSGVLPEWLNQFQTLGQIWTAYREGQTNVAVTWLSNYLRELPSDTAVMPFLPMASDYVTLGTGMSWAVASPDENHQTLAVQLAEFLVQPEFLSTWTAAAGYIPPRPSSLDTWVDAGLRSTVSQVALMTRLRPTNDLIASLGPVLREGTRQILQGLVDPGQAAQAAVESLEE
jgi:multiple sugar transport system substrate-binding protein